MAVAVKLHGANIIGGEDGNEVVTAVPITKELQSQFVNEAAVLTTLRHPVSITRALLEGREFLFRFSS